MRRLDTALVLSCLALGVGCSGSGGGPTPPHSMGTDSFESQSPRGSGGTAATDRAGAPTAAPGTATPGAAAGAPRTVEEADIYKRVGSTLYVLNAFRGLQILDLSDLARPRLLSRVPLTGTPVDLYVHGTTAFVAVSDSFAYVLAADGAMRPQRGSRLLAVDVTDPSRPAVLAELPIEGELEQTRIVGDVLYVVSRNFWWYDWSAVAPASVGGVAVARPGTVAPTTDTVLVASFDVKDPAHPRPVARLELPSTGWDAHANVTAERITLSLAGWENDGQGNYGPATHFQVVDISDPAGAMKSGAAFSTRGTVRDRWGMDFDAATGLFRAVVANGWNGGASLEIWSSSSPAGAAPISRLDIAVPESLTAARFDGSRVYLVTARRADPLWAVDASDPAKPVLAGSLAMPGQLDFIEPRGDRLVALGHTDEAGQPFQLAVSLLDVSQLGRPLLLSRAVFGASWGWVTAQPDDLRKAFIVLDPPPAGIGLVLVPVQGWDQKTYAFTGGTQLVDFARDALTLRGFLAHPGSVKRSFPADAAGTHLVALSDTALQTVDATDRSQPKELARLDLARSVQTLALIRGKAVELSGDWYRGAMELVVTEGLDPEAASPLARVTVAAPSARMFRDGDVVWLLTQDWSTNRAWLEAIDFADPLNPRRRGRLDLAAADGLGTSPGQWGFGDEALLVGHALAVHHASWGCFEVCVAGGAGAGAVTGEAVRVYDLSDPDRPKLAASVTIPDGAWAWGLQSSGSYLWLTHFEWRSPAVTGRYYVDRIDLSDPSHPTLLAKVNVPGVFFAGSQDGRRLYTLETSWKDDQATTWAHGLELTADGKARLFGSAPLRGYPSGSAAGAGFAWIATSDWSNGQSKPRLYAVSLAAMAVTSEQTVEGGWTWLRSAAGGKLFLQASWQDQGILIYGLGDPARPAFERFFRTQGWVSDIVVGGGWAYLPSGPYGVPMVKLAGP